MLIDPRTGFHSIVGEEELFQHGGITQHTTPLPQPHRRPKHSLTCTDEHRVPAISASLFTLVKFIVSINIHKLCSDGDLNLTNGLINPTRFHPGYREKCFSRAYPGSSTFFILLLFLIQDELRLPGECKTVFYLYIYIYLSKFVTMGLITDLQKKIFQKEMTD